MASLASLDKLIADLQVGGAGGAAAPGPGASKTGGAKPPAASTSASAASSTPSEKKAGGGGAAASIPASGKAKGGKASAGATANAEPAKAASSPAEPIPVDPAAAAEAQRVLDLVLSVGEECQTVEDLKNLLAKKPNFTCYDGFEPSGRMHIAQGLFKAINVNKLTSVGGTFVFWVADWFALMNDKMGGDLSKIQTVGRYLIEVWKAAGMDMDRVRFLWCADEITSKADTYWPKMLDIARCFDLDRIKKCCMIMARAENKLTGAQILYPLMQCTDIFFLRADVCQLGVDQRKVNMLARDYCGKVGIKLKPVILSHHMLFGLKEGQQKMSKSDADSAIFMEDTAEDVERKIRQAHCPREEAADAGADATPGEDAMHLVKDGLQNPCLDYVRYIVFGAPGATFPCAGKTYPDHGAVREAFLAGAITETELKDALIAAVNKLLQPVRDHFQNDASARELLAQVRRFTKDPVNPGLRRLDLLAAADKACVVCMPFVASHVTLGAVLSTARLLEAAPADCLPVLWVRDWSAIALNCFDGQAKFIAAANTVFLAALRALRPALMERTRVLFQSQAILQDPSNYWISAINVGRAYMLDELLALDSPPANQQAGYVVKVLMHAADMLALSPTSAVCHPSERALFDFAERHRAATAAALPPVRVETVEGVDARLRDSPTPGLVLDPDCEYTVLDSASADAGSKMKKAFCAVGDVEKNAPLRLAQDFLVHGASLTVKRKEENGGNATYTSADELRNDFASQALHPGDLKPAVVALVQDALSAIQTELKAKPEAKKAEGDLKTGIKQLAKKSKK